MNLMDAYPSIADLEAPARRRAPHVAWEYLDSGTGPEEALARNRAALSAVTLTPRFITDASAPELATEVLGHALAAPFGVAPVGLQSLLWPGAEVMLAAAAREAGVPYCLSTVSAETIEEVAEAAGDRLWFQLYAPRDPDIRADLLKRARAVGVDVLLLTVDVPVPSRRERQRRSGLGMPPRMTPRMIADFLSHPAWLRATLARGKPRLINLERYARPEELSDITAFVGRQLNGSVSPELLAAVREEWPGKLVVKGIMDVDEARLCVEAGADAIMVSNHGGRQLDLAPASIEALPGIVEAVGERAAILFDSGVRTGMDIARALALGADLVLIGRPFLWSAMALGAPGPAHAMTVFREELANVMTNLGCATLAELPARAAAAPARPAGAAGS